MDQMDKNYVRGSLPIDSIALSNGIMNYAEGLELSHQNKIVMSDYRACIMDINIEEYFDSNFSN